MGYELASIILDCYQEIFQQASALDKLFIVNSNICAKHVFSVLVRIVKKLYSTVCKIHIIQEQIDKQRT